MLSTILSPQRHPIHDKCVVIVAHPDDEVLACGALLGRLRDLTLVHVTDGAVRDDDRARRQGFTAFEAAGVRRHELEQAMAIAGVPAAALEYLAVADQRATHALPDIARRLAPLIRDTTLVLTHAFEGGHPDHDATAFAVQAAVALIEAGASRPQRIEMPLYRAGAGGAWLRQSFPDDGRPAAILRLSETEREHKSQMLDVYASQRDVLADFGAADESYRVAPAYDFTRPPNGGDILYERYDWGMTFAQFAAHARSALRELGLNVRGVVPCA